MCLRPAQGDERRLLSRNHFPWKCRPLLCHPACPGVPWEPRDLQFRGLFLEMFFDRAQSKDLRLLFVALAAAEKFGIGQERRTSGAKARRILHHLRPD